MSTTSVALLPDKAASKVEPKPNRREIIEALVQLKREEHRKNYAEWHKRWTKAQEEARAALIEFVKANADKPCLTVRAHTGYLSSGSNGAPCNMSVSFDINKLPSDVERKVVAIHKMQCLEAWDEKQVRKDIAEAINAKTGKGDRVKLMLETPAIRKALLTMLNEFNEPAPAALEA